MRAGAQDVGANPCGHAALQPDDAGHRAPVQRPQQLDRLLHEELSAVAFLVLSHSRKKLRTSQESASDSSSNSLAQSTPGSVSPSASEPVSRGIPQHGFSSRYVSMGASDDVGTQGDAGVGSLLRGLRRRGQEDPSALRREVHQEARPAEERRAVPQERGLHHGTGRPDRSPALQLDHPNIVRLEGFYDDKDYYYIVSELVDGRRGRGR